MSATEEAVEQAVASAPRTAWFVRLTRTAEKLAGHGTDISGHEPLFLTWDGWVREAGAKLPGRIGPGARLPHPARMTNEPRRWARHTIVPN